MDNNKYVLVLDLGKGAAKALGCNANDDISNPKNIKKVIFDTKSYDLSKGYTELQGNSYKVNFDGEDMILGEQGTDKSFQTSKTTKLHKFCAYTLISQFIKPNTTDNEIYIVLACPVTVLKSDKAKQEYKDFIKGDGVINITVNDEKYEFEIKDILIKAESSGILYLIPEEFKNKKVLVTDFGGHNMTNTVFTNGTCANPEADRFADEHGSTQLINKISNHLTTYNNGNIVDVKTSEEALKRNHLLEYGKPDLNSVPHIDNAKKEFLEEALSTLERKHVHPKHMDKVIFIGGTSTYLKEQIKVLPNAQLTDNPQWSSVEGLFKIAVKKFIK